MLEVTVITDEQRETLEGIFNFLVEVFGNQTKKGTYKKNQKRRKILKESHIFSLVPFMKAAIDSDTDAERFGEWVDSFYLTDDGETSISEEYNDACKGGNAKNTNIQARNVALQESFDGFFNQE